MGAICLLPQHYRANATYRHIWAVINIAAAWQICVRHINKREINRLVLLSVRRRSPEMKAADMKNITRALSEGGAPSGARARMAGLAPAALATHSLACGKHCLRAASAGGRCAHMGRAACLLYISLRLGCRGSSHGVPSHEQAPACCAERMPCCGTYYRAPLRIHHCVRDIFVAMAALGPLLKR